MTDQSAGPSAKLKPGPLILLVLLIAAICAAWQVHKAFFASDPATPGRGGPRSGRPDRLADNRPGAMFSRIMGNFLAEDGVTPLQGHPGGIAPPPGTTTRSRPEWHIKGNYRTERASYNVPGQVAEVQTYYTQALNQAGLTVIGVRPDQAGGRIVTFEGPTGLGSLGLRKSRDNDRMTWVIVMINLPVDAADGDR